MTIDHASAVPPYRQLAGILRDQIASGELAPGAMVPSVKRLRQEYGVAETTARKAVALLRAEGLVETVMGWGTFVAKDLASGEVTGRSVSFPTGRAALTRHALTCGNGKCAAAG